jgi:DNA-binding NarL/FixJ family response regulator
MNTGSIWIIDSDTDDQEMVQQVWWELQLTNELKFLSNAEETMNLLDSVQTAPFIIICELNLPKINGFELREKMLATNSLKFKSVPFIFWTTQASEEQIIRAYDLSVHGFFIKEPRYEELKMTFIHILNYWLRSKMPIKKEKVKKF